MKEMHGIDLLIQTKPSELSGGSTDFGNVSKAPSNECPLTCQVSYTLPALHPLVGIPIKPGHNNHTPGFTEHAKTDEAHNATLKAAAALSVVACRVLSDEQFTRDVSDTCASPTDVKARSTWEETLRRVAEEV